jgi:hypothetical protein
MCMTALYPAQMIDLCSRMTSWASNTLPVWIGLTASQSTKPGLTSSSSTPFTLTLTFSPGTIRPTSSSSESNMSTVTGVCNCDASTLAQNPQISLLTHPVRHYDETLTFSTLARFYFTHQDRAHVFVFVYYWHYEGSVDLPV